MKRFAAIFLILFTTLIGVSASAEPESTPDQIVHKTADDILSLIKAHRAEYAKDTSKLYVMVQEHILPNFDFERMAQWVLGRSWKQANDAQRKQFVREFQNVLVRTYSTALLSYNDQEVHYLPSNFKPDSKESTVKVEVKQNNGAPDIPMQYMFYKAPTGWRIYDMNIDGVDLVSNYRSIYASKIRQSGLDGLLASMATANKQNKK